MAKRRDEKKTEVDVRLPHPTFVEVMQAWSAHAYSCHEHCMKFNGDGFASRFFPRVTKRRKSFPGPLYSSQSNFFEPTVRSGRELGDAWNGEW